MPTCDTLGQSRALSALCDVLLELAPLQVALLADSTNRGIFFLVVCSIIRLDSAFRQLKLKLPKGSIALLDVMGYNPYYPIMPK